MKPKPVSRDFATLALLLCATVAVYWQAIPGTLLWDDSGHVTRLDLQSWRGLGRVWFDLGATQQYYPLLHTAFWLEHHLWGGSVIGYHLVNIALHAIAAWLVVLLARRLALPGGGLAGVLFAIHPVCVEAVAWISEQKSTLSAVFYLGAALVYLKFDESRQRSRYFAALALFLLALATKTVTATLPAALLVVIWWRRGRIGWKRDLQPLVPWFVLGASAGLFTAWVEKTFVGARGADFSLTAVDRALLAGRAFWFYAGKAIWPAHLTFFYPRWKMDPAIWWQWRFPAGVAVLAWVLWRVSRRHRGPLAVFLVFAAALFPALGFFDVYPFRYSFVADHFAYLAMLAVVVPAAAILSKTSTRAALAAIPVAALAAVTWVQAGTYRNEETLYRATLGRNPAAWLAHNNLGNSLLAAPGGRAEAIAHFREALRLKPDFWEAHLSLGNAWMETPDGLEAAIAEYETAARLAPGSERVHTNLGNALLRAGRTDDAIAQLQTALRIQPSNAEAHNDLGNAYAQLPGRESDAIAEYHAALAANPEFAGAHNNLGRALAQSGRLPEAIAEFEAAIRARPDSWTAHSNLGNALARVPGRLADAVAEYQTALRLQPDSAAAHNNLGFALSQMPDRLADAAAEYRKAIALDARSADAHYNLGSLLLRVPGHRAEALAEFEAVMRLKPNPRVQEILAQLRAARN